MLPKPPACKGCPLENVGIGFVPFDLKPGPHLMVGEAPGEEEAKQGKCFSGGSGQWLRNLCKSARLPDLDKITLTNTILCRPPGNVYPNDPNYSATSREDGLRAIEHCATHHLWPNLERAAKPKIFAIGGQALRALTGKEGINTWRGSPLPLKGGDHTQVIPTLHPANLMRQSKLTSAVVSDLKKSLILPPERYNLCPSFSDLEKWQDKVFAFDLEWDKNGAITVCGLSSRFYEAIVVPWIEPFISLLRTIFEGATDLIGHNIIGADLPYLERAGWKIGARIHDTMLKQHLIQPDYPHSLAFTASIFTNKVFWKGKWEEEESEEVENVGGQQWRSWDKSWALPRKLGGYGGCHSASEAFALYNARDTDAEFQVNTPLSHLLSKYELEGTYWNVSLPIAYVCRGMGHEGVRIDSSKLGEVRTKLDTKINELEARLPEGLKPYEISVGCNIQAPPGTFKNKIKECKGTRKVPHEPYKHTFTNPGSTATCPECQRKLTPGKMGEAKVIRGTRLEKVIPYNSPPLVQKYVEACNLKEVLDSKTGRKTTGKRARKLWAKEHPEFTLLGALKQQITLRNNFAKDSLLSQERMYFNLKVHGTSEGRLSSTGMRRGVDLNIQNQPKEFRSIYIPDQEGWSFLNLDIVQGENMLTTWLAKDWERWERINQPGYDEHCDLASRIFGRPITKSEEDKPFRDIGKKINHGRNYGMGVKKQRDSLLEAGFEHYSEGDVKEFISIWKEMNSRTAEWQFETISLAEKQSYLRNPFGRVRWFSSRDLATKALAFLPASTLADMVLRMMIAHFPTEPHCEEALTKLGLETYISIVDGWRMCIQVHDSIVLQGPSDGWKEQATRSKMIMEQTWKELDGFRFKASVEHSDKSWGECKGVKV